MMENTALQRFLMLTEVRKENKAAQKYLGSSSILLPFLSQQFFTDTET